MTIERFPIRICARSPGSALTLFRKASGSRCSKIRRISDSLSSETPVADRMDVATMIDRWYTLVRGEEFGDHFFQGDVFDGDVGHGAFAQDFLRHGNDLLPGHAKCEFPIGR